MAKKNKNKRKKTNLEIARENISAAFREGKKSGVTVVKNNFRNSSYETYEKTMHTMINQLSDLIGHDNKRVLPKFMNGKVWNQYFDQLAERYERGEITGATIQKRVHALEAWRTMVRETNVLGKDQTVRVGNKSERLDYLNERGVVRKIDEVTSIKPKHEEVKVVHDNIDREKRNGETSYQINKLQVECGGRIKSVFKLEVRDIDFKNNTITFRNDKNNFTRIVPMTPGARKILSASCFGKSAGSPVFTCVDKDGNDLKQDKAVKVVQRHTNEAAKRSGVNRSARRRYVTHSNRKRYAQNLYDATRTMSKSQLKKEISSYIELQGSNREQLHQRIKNELIRINDYRIRNKMPKRGFTHEHLRRLYVSLHLGHSRTDISLRYVKPDNYAKHKAV